MKTTTKETTKTNLIELTSVWCLADVTALIAAGYKVINPTTSLQRCCAVTIVDPNSKIEWDVEGQVVAFTSTTGTLLVPASQIIKMVVKS